MKEQQSLFDYEESKWQDEWIDMPEYNNFKQSPPLITATFKFKSKEDFDLFMQSVRRIYLMVKEFLTVSKKRMNIVLGIL